YACRDLAGPVSRVFVSAGAVRQPRSVPAVRRQADAAAQALLADRPAEQSRAVSDGSALLPRDARISYLRPRRAAPPQLNPGGGVWAPWHRVATSALRGSEANDQP